MTCVCRERERERGRGEERERRGRGEGEKEREWERRGKLYITAGNLLLRRAGADLSDNCVLVKCHTRFLNTYVMK